MKLIEALKTVKLNEKKIADFQERIRRNSARLSNETSPYDDPTKQVTEWVQTCIDLNRSNTDLIHRIHKTNSSTTVPITIGGKQVFRTIDEWIHRRTHADTDRRTMLMLTDRNLREGSVEQSNGERVEVSIVRHYDAAARDQQLEILMEEPTLIDSQLEIVNAITDLVD